MKTEKINVLLIEDDPIDVRSIRKAIDSIKADVGLYLAKNGDEGLDMLRNNKVPPNTFIILDLVMPGMNGIDFLSLIRDDDELKSKMVFVLTVSKNEEAKYKSYGLNVSGFFKKPLSRSEFQETIELIIDFYQLNEFSS